MLCHVIPLAHRQCSRSLWLMATLQSLPLLLMQGVDSLHGWLFVDVGGNRRGVAMSNLVKLLTTVRPRARKRAWRFIGGPLPSLLFARWHPDTSRSFTRADRTRALAGARHAAADFDLRPAARRAAPRLARLLATPPDLATFQDPVAKGALHCDRTQKSARQQPLTSSIMAQ